MSQRPTLQTVARAAGVSTATVSQVIRGSGRISEETRKRVLRAVKQVNYVPDGRASAMRSGQFREIGLLIHEIANPFNAEVISGVSDHLENEGYLVSVLDSRDDPVRQRRHLETLIGSARGGLLWVPAQEGSEEVERLILAQRVPTVTFLRRPHSRAFDHVGIENREATRQATAHLADLGHRHIAFFGGDKDVESRLDRIEGCRAVLAERGLPPPVVWPCPDSKRAGLEHLGRLLQAHPRVTALVCNGDMVALGALQALLRSGRQAGSDLSVIGFDDIQDAALAMPPLTTMSVQPYQLGRRLARTLVERIREPGLPPASVAVPATLVRRESCGPPKTQKG
ncbi:MAG: LacI family transcriptional regulator [Alphaproteobacteria bacterium]|nr:MAG: LacI family transcriptional regulator [Alphaproteobacteria bacterium]